MNKIALFILYNHHFTKNIERVEELYKGKFSYVYHLIPFYNGERENVIPVYESSFQFQSYISQAYQHVKKEKFSHFFIVADDMIINPNINENNLFLLTGIPNDSAFITFFKFIPEFLYANIKMRGVEVNKILPSKKEAKKIFDERKITVLPNSKYAVKLFFESLLHLRLGLCRQAISYICKRHKDYIYPVVWGYSDILLIPETYMDNFVRYCGAFAALNLFVEVAIPTALCLSCDNITLGEDIKLKYVTQLYALGIEGQKAFEKKYAFSITKLLDEYPSDVFYIHPLKLSKWV